MQSLIRIDSGYFVAGAIVEGDLVVQTAPILKYMRGWSIQRVVGYSMSKGWSVIQCRRDGSSPPECSPGPDDEEKATVPGKGASFGTVAPGGSKGDNAPPSSNLSPTGRAVSTAKKEHPEEISC